MLIDVMYITKNKSGVIDIKENRISNIRNVKPSSSRKI